MLNAIRLAANTLVFRCVLVIIIISFIIWGVTGIFSEKKSDDYIITSKTANNITLQEFLKDYSIYFNHISLNKELSKSEINSIQEKVIEASINKLLIKQLGKEYNLNFGDNKIAEIITKDPYFLGPNKEFDIARYNNFLIQERISEKDYIKKIKVHLINNIIFSNFIDSIYVPSFLSRQVVNYLAEEKMVDYVVLDLNRKIKKINAPDLGELLKFYNINKEQFRIPERRKISYIIFDNNYFHSKITVNDSDIQQYIEANNITILDVEKKNLVINEITNSKTKDIINEIINNIEDEVGAGSNLLEIYNKFGGKYVCLPELNLLELKNTKVKDFADKAFSMSKSEISSPIFFNDGLVLLELNDINISNIPHFDLVKDQVKYLWEKDFLRKVNIDMLKKLLPTLNNINFNKSIKSLNLPLITGFKIIRNKSDTVYQLPQVLINQIFLALPDKILSYFDDKNKAYLVLVRKSRINSTIADDISKKSLLDINKSIKEAFFKEMLQFLRNEYKIKINKNILDSFLEEE